MPVVVAAQDSSAAMLRSNGVGIFVDGKQAPASIALFRDDYVQTQKSTVARIELTGSSVDVGAETIFQFEGDELVLDHGHLSVYTSRGLRVRVGCQTVIPVRTAEWTRYDVSDVDGKLHVAALKDDVNINTRSKNFREGQPVKDSDRVTVREGENRTRDDRCGAGYNPAHTVAGNGAILDSPLAVASGGVIAVGITCWAVCLHNDDPISPSKP